MKEKKQLSRHLIFLILILVFSLFASQKLITDKFYTSHDGGGHIIRMIEFDDALREGQFPVRLAKRINHGLSYPYFNFNYPFIYYVSSLIHRLGFDFVTVFKMIMFTSVLIGGISMYFFTRLYFDSFAALISSVFYIIAPYRFLNMYVRGTVAEAFALGLLPLLFFSIEQTIRKKGTPLLIIVLSLLILSHNITALFAVPLVVLYFLIRIRKEQNKLYFYRQIIMAMTISLLLTTFFWLPAILENGLTKLTELTEDYRAFFPSIKDIIYSPWGFGAFQQGEVPGKMSPQIGIAHTLVSIIALATLLITVKVRRKLEEKDLLLAMFLILSLLLFFLMFETSLILWDNIYYLKLVQHPWRLVGYIVFFSSIGAGYVVSSIRSKTAKIVLSALLIILLIYANRNHIRVNQYIDFENPFEKAQVYGPSTTSKDEHMPKYAPRIFEDPNPDGDIIPKEAGTSQRLVWKSNYHLFKVSLGSDADFRDNTSYFPGWRAKVNGAETKINHGEDPYKRLRVSLPAGKHRVEFFFEETWYRLLADLTSFSTLVLLGVIFLHQAKNGRKAIAT